MEVKFRNDKHYEETIVQALIADSNYAEQMMEVLSVEYFNIEYLKQTVKILFDYYAKYKVFPSYKMLGGVVKNDVADGALKDQMMQYLIKIKTENIANDIEYAKETALDFCKKRALAKALEVSLSLISEKKYEQIKGEVEKALRAGSEKNVGHVYEDAFELRMQKELYVPIPTPWSEINSRTKGGPGKGKLAVVAALSGVGKSHCLVHLGAHAVMNGYNVVHYTLELDEIDVGHRYDSCISEVGVDDLYDNKDFIKERLDEKLKGKLIIKSYPTKTATVQTLKNHYNNLLLRGLKPDIILIDYADLLKSSQNYEAKRFNEEAVYEETRAWSMEIQTPIWTATQINRSGEDVEVLTLKYVSECFAKAMIADLFITINRKKDSPTPELGNMFIAKNRMGADGIKLPMMINTSISKLQVLAPEHGTDSENEEEYMAKLRQKLKEFNKNKTDFKTSVN